MRPRVLWVLLVFFGIWSRPAAADNRFIVRVPDGLTAVQQVCLTLGCTVSGGIDGDLGRVFLVTTSDLANPQAFLQTLISQPAITNAEFDSLLKVMQIATTQVAGSAPPSGTVQTAGAPQSAGTAPPSGLSDTTAINYFGVTVIDGYVNQPANTIIRISDTQTAYNVTGAGTVAVIDTGVDPTHPALQGVLVPGYDFTRNISGSGSELTDVNQSSIGSGASPVMVNQESAAILDQQSASNLRQPQYEAFGHGTMVSGIIHLVAPTALIMPLKAFKADGTGYLSDVLRAIYFAAQNGARVINMSFSISTYSSEMANAVKFADHHQVICVASAGNDGRDEAVYPAALADVMAIASTTNNDTRSSFSNYGEDLVWVGAPGEGIVTTYPFGTYGAGWGTSFSAPFVSGAAALLLSTNMKFREPSAAGALAHAVWISDDLGNGRVDLYQALNAALNHPPD